MALAGQQTTQPLPTVTGRGCWVQGMTEAKYQMMPPLSPEEYASLKEDIRTRGVLVPIELDEQGNILDGHHRRQVCAELGITDFPSVVRSGFSEDEKQQHVCILNLGRRHLSQDARRALWRQLYNNGMTQAEIAAKAGVSQPTVNRAINYAGCINGKAPDKSENETAPLPEPAAAEGTRDPDPEPESLSDATVEILLRHACPEAMEALDAGDPERASALLPTRMADETSEAAVSPPAAKPIPAKQSAELVYKVQEISIALEDLAQAPLTGKEFKRLALPLTLQEARQHVPQVRALLDEIERDEE